VVQRKSWSVPPIFHLLKNRGNIPEAEMLRTFNNGIGLIAVVPEDAAQEVLARLNGMNEKAFVIGEIAERKSGPQFKWV